MSRDKEIDRRARLRSALVKAGREERASDSLRASLLAVAAGAVATAPVAIAAASSRSVAVTKTAAVEMAATVAPAASGSTGAAFVSANGMVGWKVLAVLLAIGAIGTGASFFARQQDAAVESPAPVVTTAAAPVAAPEPASTTTTTAVHAPQEIASVSIDDLPTVKAAPSIRSAPSLATTTSSQPAPTASPPSPAARLTEETRAVGSIRGALQKGDTREALRLLDVYEAEFPRGILAEEAEVLRIETLIRAGDKGEAAKRASRFLAERPSSPHAARVRTMTRRLTEPD